MLLRRPGQIAAFLAILTSVGPISTDMYLPAFPAMRLALNGGTASSQLTLASWFVGLAFGQVTFGPLSDHLGRRRPLLIGTLLYGFASVGCALAGDIPTLCMFRVVAAFGGSASLVIPRAVIRDLVRDNVGAARLLSRLVLVMGIVPVLAPTLGSLISSVWGWRAIFWAAALYGGGCAVAIWAKLPDTLPRGFRMRQRLAAVIVGYLTIGRERTFLTHALEGSFATFTLFAFLGGASSVFELGDGMSPVHFGLVFVLNASGYILGAQGNARLMPRFGPDRLLTLSCRALFAATVLVLVSAVAGFHVWGLIVPLVLVMTALGFVLPGAAVGSILPHAGRAGSASALYGTMVFFIGAGGTIAVGLGGERSPIAMAVLMVIGSGAAIAIDRKRPRRARRERPVAVLTGAR